MNIIEVLINPDTFFKKLSQKEISLKEPFLIVLVFSILISISTYISTSVMFKIFPPQYQQIMSFIKVISLISTFIGGLISWIIIAGIMHLISIAFKGKGKFKKTLSFVGYGFLPNIIGALITIPIAYYYLSHIHVQPLSIEQLQNPIIVQKVVKSIIPKSLVYFNLFVGIGVTLWNLYIWTFAIKYARNLDIKKAFITALIPTIIFGLYQLYNIIKLIFG
ncbi:YIP1 family protein [Methanocaldococcus indicus]|uniref:YIP1 family protein n=1 Tax=Methanocaldococcus indicus TaxID=213231 RepID=UPI003C6D9A97